MYDCATLRFAFLVLASQVIPLEVKTILKTAGRRGVLAGFLIAVCASQSYAIATYTHVGGNYVTATAGYTTSMHVEGSFTVANPFGPNFVGDITGDVLSFSFNDGVRNYSSGDPELVINSFFTQTDSNGDIAVWEMVFETPSPASLTLVGQQAHTLFIDSFVGDSVSEYTCIGVGAVGCILNLTDVAQAPVAFGSWTRTITALPEPGSFFLLLSGIAGLGLLRRRRKAGARI